MTMDDSKLICAITGPTSGIGTATADALAERGMRLVLLCRNEDKGRDLAVALERRYGTDVDVVRCELGSLADVRRAGAEMRERYPRLDILINNAGMMTTRRELTDDGFESMFGVNHLGHYLLTHELMPLLQDAARARLVVVASDAHGFSRGIRFDDLNADGSFSTFGRYGHSKLANMLFVHELARRLPADEVAVHMLHPGAVTTSLGAQNTRWASLVYGLLKPFFRTPAKGAETSVWCATTNELGSATGGYYFNCAPRAMKPWAQDDAAAAKLWQVSAELTGVDPDWPRTASQA